MQPIVSGAEWPRVPIDYQTAGSHRAERAW